MIDVLVRLLVLLLSLAIAATTPRSSVQPAGNPAVISGAGVEGRPNADPDAEGNGDRNSAERTSGAPAASAMGRPRERPSSGVDGAPPTTAPTSTTAGSRAPRSPARVVTGARRTAGPTVEPRTQGKYGVPWLSRTGIASTYGRGWSEWWVALPHGPGWRFTVCGAGGCRTLVSHDAGPSLAMQRAGRIVDLPPIAFSDVCGVPVSAGLCQVSITIRGKA